jgi:hypothetical protein
MIKTFESPPHDVQQDIDYIYNIVIDRGGKRAKNYYKQNLDEPVIAVSVRYNELGNPVSTARMLARDCYESSVRVFDRYALIEGNNGLLPKNYDGLFKISSSNFLEAQADFCINLGYKCIFLSMELRAKRTLQRVCEGHNKYSKHDWYFIGPEYVTYKKSIGGLQYLVYTGREFRRNDGLYYSRLED